MADQGLQEIRILNQKGRLVRNGEHPIYLLEDGRFAVKHGRAWKTAKTLQGVEAFITKERKYVALMAIYTNHPPTKLEVCGRVAGKMVTLDGTKLGGWGSYYLYNEDIIKKLNDYNKRKQASDRKFEAEREKIMNKAVEVGGYNLDEMLDKHGVNASIAAKKTKKKK